VSGAAAGAAGAPALKLSGVCKSFGKTEIIRGVDLQVPIGERHALIGPNGAGKSTLFNLVSARLAVSSGSIELKGTPITGLPPNRINRMGLSRSFQITNIFPRLSVFENIRCATLYALGYRYSFWHRLSRLRDAAEQAEDVMNQIGLRYRRDTLASNLTYAEQRALEIGITVASGADVILLDEPTAGMTIEETRHTAGLVRHLATQASVVIIEHDMAFIRALEAPVTVLHLGRVLTQGSLAEVERDERVLDVYLGRAGADDRTSDPLPGPDPVSGR
jgi:branched-chain amino acid transport system ATP-binding protein